MKGVFDRTSVRIILLAVLVFASHGARAEAVPDPLAADPLAVDAAMTGWAAALADRGPAPRRLGGLATALGERGWRHADDLTLPAAEAFARREGDCVSFAFVLAALARQRGLSVVFVILAPEAAARAGRFAVGRGHLAVAVEVRRGFRVFDAGGERGDAALFRAVTDRQAVAIFHSNRGSALLLAGRPAEAVGELRRATKVGPDLAVAWTNLGVGLTRLGDAEAAERAYRQAVSLAPESAGAWRNLALLLERRLALEPETTRSASAGKEPR